MFHGNSILFNKYFFTQEYTNKYTISLNVAHENTFILKNTQTNTPSPQQAGRNKDTYIAIQQSYATLSLAI